MSWSNWWRGLSNGLWDSKCCMLRAESRQGHIATLTANISKQLGGTCWQRCCMGRSQSLWTFVWPSTLFLSLCSMWHLKFNCKYRKAQIFVINFPSKNSWTGWLGMPNNWSPWCYASPSNILCWTGLKAPLSKQTPLGTQPSYFKNAQRQWGRADLNYPRKICWETEGDLLYQLTAGSYAMSLIDVS